MGLFGMGKAFDLRFRPNGPLRTNIYQRPGPKMGPIPMGGNYSYTENINIQTTPGGFWGFMSGFLGGLTGGMGFGGFGMPGYGLSSMGGFAPLGGLFGNQSMLYNQNALTQSNTGNEDKYLKSLSSALSSQGTFSKHPDKDGIYIMTTKDGQIIEDTYQNLLDRFKNNTPPTALSVKPEGTVRETDEQKLAKLQQQKADAHNPKLHKEGDKWFNSDKSKEFKWNADKNDFDPIETSSFVPPDNGNDDSEVASGTVRTDRGTRSQRTGGATGTGESGRLSDAENKSAPYTATVKWTTVPIMNSLHLVKGYQCTAIVSFTDKNGDKHVYEHTDKFESYTESGREAKCKANVIAHIQNSIKNDGWSKVTIK